MDDCAVMDISSDGTILLKRRMDNAPVQRGYLGIYGDEEDKRNHHSGYLTDTSEQITSWRLLDYDDGYLL